MACPFFTRPCPFFVPKSSQCSVPGAHMSRGQILSAWIDSASWAHAMEYRLGHVPPSQPLVGSYWQLDQAAARCSAPAAVGVSLPLQACCRAAAGDCRCRTRGCPVMLISTITGAVPCWRRGGGGVSHGGGTARAPAHGGRPCCSLHMSQAWFALHAACSSGDHACQGWAARLLRPEYSSNRSCCLLLPCTCRL